jgi:hypothetical protein
MQQICTRELVSEEIIERSASSIWREESLQVYFWYGRIYNQFITFMAK